MEKEISQRGGRRSGAGRKSAFGSGVETAQYMLPKDHAQECQAFARMTLANGGVPPMRCIGDHAEYDARLPRGTAKDLLSIVERVREFDSRIEMEVRRVDGEFEYAVIKYTDVADLVGIMMEYSELQGERNAKRRKKESKG